MHLQGNTLAYVDHNPAGAFAYTYGDDDEILETPAYDEMLRIARAAARTRGGVRTLPNYEKRKTSTGA
jgi:hypothetical protein